ncbi:nitrate- and nitrite sensing domain-containing protein [Dactylosporangium sucinum]|uniref:sensor histidine kinase n=1 Tax=Dactylosporangium sucinum TaxID=1424081 RepID=UPI0035E7D8E7
MLAFRAAVDGVMRSRSTNLRAKITALLLSLAALWAFAAWVTLREGLNLFWVQAHNSNIYQPSEPLLRDLQSERRLSTAYLGAPGDQQRQNLTAGRQQTEQASAAFRTSAQSWQANPSGDEDLQRAVDKVIAGLDGLAAVRAQIDARTIDRAAASTAFTQLVDSLFEVYDSLGGLDDKVIAADAAALIQLNRTWELISQEDALLTGSIAAGRMTADEHAQFVQIVGAQRFLASDTVASLSSADQARYSQMAGGKDFTAFRAVEDRVIAETRAGVKPPTSNDEWRAVVDPALADLHDVVVTGGKDIVARSTPVAIWVLIRLVLAAGLGLATVIASIIVSITTARQIVRQLERLRDAARQLADERLPSVVARLSRGEQVDVDHEAPPLEFGDDEIGQVGQAFNAVQETAIRAAVEQADLRRSVRDVFLSIARRSQSLVHRQLKLLDGMERREGDPAKLDELFRVDHLSTRMRRNAENLIVLAGSSPGRVWKRTVPMVDIVRGAIAEVEDFARVKVYPIKPVELAGRAVSDVIHLVAELVENALSFSPPHTEVHVKGQLVGTGFVLEVEDRGLGIAPDEIAELNQRIASHPEFTLSSAARLGLFVVSRLAERHGIRVQLKESPYGGTTAVVLIPKHLLGEGTVNGEANGIPASSPRAAAAVSGTHRLEGSDVDFVPPTSERRPVALAEPPRMLGVDLAAAMSAIPTPEPQEPPGAMPAAGNGAQLGASADAEGTFTQGGLPVRMRQANLAAGLRDGDPVADSPAPATELRSPEQVFSRISSYQQGSRQGRADAPRDIDSPPSPLPTRAASDGNNEQPTT